MQADFLNKWDLRFLVRAKLFSTYSKDTTKVGCSIVREKHELTSGYNGFPASINDSVERINNRELKLKYTIHAEMNAILQAGRLGISLEGVTAFIYGLMPCQECAKHIVAVGIKRVVYKINPSITVKPEWSSSLEFVKELFNEAGVEFIEYTGEVDIFL